MKVNEQAALGAIECSFSFRRWSKGGGQHTPNESAESKQE